MSKELIESILTEDRFEKLYAAIDENIGRNGPLMPTLHAAQNIFGAIPYEVQKVISERMNVPLAEIYGVVTFYSRFSLVPKGEFVVSVCLGTACYVKGAQNIIDEIEKIIDVKVGETSSDGKFTLEATRCIGACGLAPVMSVNEEIHGRVLVSDVNTIMAKYL
ncbi:MAG: NAD(P)H-dependent oxidoreductase subunit E [Bacillota bacterium]|nr:NAD(P)H-dependent oxidoreductase subunit E [Bacillota bacterium]